MSSDPRIRETLFLLELDHGHEKHTARLSRAKAPGVAGKPARAASSPQPPPTQHVKKPDEPNPSH